MEVLKDIFAFIGFVNFIVFIVFSIIVKKNIDKEIMVKDYEEEINLEREYFKAKNM